MQYGSPGDSEHSSSRMEVLLEVNPNQIAITFESNLIEEPFPSEWSGDEEPLRKTECYAINDVSKGVVIRCVDLALEDICTERTG